MASGNKSADLEKIARQMVTRGKGILAADESSSTIEKKFTKVGIPCTEATRREYRGLFFTSEGFGEYISGVILYDETIRQSHRDGRKLVSIIEDAGVLPGIKVDLGLKEMDGSPNEKITKGLEGLAERLKEYAGLGAKFAKWRAVINIGEGIPTDANIRQNAKDLAAYAKACQEAGIVPIVEPEVMMDGAHTIEKCEDASERTLKAIFEELKKANVALPGMILKTNMVLPGKENGKATPEEIALRTVNVFRRVLPDDLPGQAFLSGGQSEVEATENLNAINKMGPHPWNLTFSYGRALQDSALRAWGGKSENIPAAQKAFLHRAKMNSLATLGKYSTDLESA
ncbi:MAG TPA: class I fructose-bisphosphate aldolase [Candidatus Paceibacterota bacterium]